MDERMVYVTVGTMFLDFGRLIRKADEIAEATGERFVVQTGLCTTVPAHCEHFDFRSRDEVLEIQAEARVIICHGGIGTVLDALEAGRPFIVVPRRASYNEHLTDHQLDLAEAVERRGWARMVLDMDDLPEACANPAPIPEDYAPARHRLVEMVREAVERAGEGIRI